MVALLLAAGLWTAGAKGRGGIAGMLMASNNGSFDFAQDDWREVRKSNNFLGISKWQCYAE